MRSDAAPHLHRPPLPFFFQSQRRSIISTSTTTTWIILVILTIVLVPNLLLQSSFSSSSSSSSSWTVHVAKEEQSLQTPPPPPQQQQQQQQQIEAAKVASNNPINTHKDNKLLVFQPALDDTTANGSSDDDDDDDDDGNETSFSDSSFSITMDEEHNNPWYFDSVAYPYLQWSPIRVPPITTTAKTTTFGTQSEYQSSSSSSSSSQPLVCSRILLFETPGRGAGIMSQLNTYLMLVLAAAVTNRQLVLWHPGDREMSNNDNHIFGCRRPVTNVSENYNSSKETGQNFSSQSLSSSLSPQGLEFLIQHPSWISGNCPLPCATSSSSNSTSLSWTNVSQELQSVYKNPKAAMAAAQTMVWNDTIRYCDVDDEGNANQQQQQQVLYTNVWHFRKYFNQFIAPKLKATMTTTRPSATEASSSSSSLIPPQLLWLQRLGATAEEIQDIQHAQSPHHHHHAALVVEHVLALLTRSGILALQPWIAEPIQAKLNVLFQRMFTNDVEEEDEEEYNSSISSSDDENESQPKLLEQPLYTAIHIRRGDKLLSESQGLIQDYWKSKGYDNETNMPCNYIPLEAYLETIVNNGGFFPNSNATAAATTTTRHIYIATDDPDTVRTELKTLQEKDGSDSYNWKHILAHWKFHWNPELETVRGHVKDVRACTERYERSVSALLDLFIMVRANVFVGEYNSNWGRLIRTLRTTYDRHDNNKNMQAVLKDVLVVFGRNYTMWPA